MTNDPILTPQRLLALRDVDMAAVRFDIAVFCFRGRSASQRMIEAIGARKVGGPLLYGCKCYQGVVGGLNVAVLPSVLGGGPVTAILLEELACLGARVAVGFGAAGSLVSAGQVDQMFIAEQAVGRDGTSREYAGEVWTAPDQELLTLARSLSAEEGISPLPGIVWTTDALYQERPSKVRRWREAGANLVNLESGPFYAVSAALNIRAVYSGLVSDYISEEEGWHDGVWSKRNTIDSIIVRVIRKLIEGIAAKGYQDV